MAPTDTDEALLSRFVRGDIAALGRLADRYESALLGLALGLMDGRQELAKDAVQDCWLRVIRSGRGFRGECSMKTWLYRIVINRCRDLRHEHFKRNGAAGPDNLMTSVRAQVAGAPGDDKRDELARALDKLPGHARLLLLLCYHHGLTHPQAAEVLEMPVGTLKSRLNGALESLRSILGTERTP